MLSQKTFVVFLTQKMVCHGEHTYLYSQVMMNILAQEQKGGSNIRRICQELQKCANARYALDSCLAFKENKVKVQCIVIIMVSLLHFLSFDFAFLFWVRNMEKG